MSLCVLCGRSESCPQDLAARFHHRGQSLLSHAKAQRRKVLNASGNLGGLVPWREILNASRITTKRIFKCYGYPPDLLEDAVKTVLAEAA